MSKSVGKQIGEFGSAYPVIKINNYGPFTKDEIISFSIDQSNFLPTCSLVLKMGFGLFLTTAFPKDGDVLNVYIRSLSSKHKPVRNDYIINSVTTTRSNDSEGDEMIYYIEGILYIPNIDAVISKAWKDKTSFEVLFDLATELKLGFVSNELQSDLKDKQTWISPNYSYREMIEDTTNHAYSTIDSFYYSFIDIYYNLNFINLNPLFSVSDKKEPETAIMRGAFNIDNSDSDEIVTQEQPLVLTNAKELKTSNYFFNSFSLTNNSGDINRIYGYTPTVHFYDKIEKKFWDIGITPTITSGSEKDKVVMLGRAGEDYYKDFKKIAYKGIQYLIPDNNCHPYWKQAEIQNKYNLDFSSKIQIELFLPLFNFNLYKCQTVPIEFIVTNSDDRGKVAGKADDDKSMKLGWSIDRFLTGNYVIFNLHIEYLKDTKEQSNRPNAAVSGKWTVKLNVRRREWPMPDVKKVNDNV